MDHTLVEQLLTLVVRGSKVDDEPGGHSDFSAAAVGALNLALSGRGRDRDILELICTVPGPGSLFWAEEGSELLPRNLNDVLKRISTIGLDYRGQPYK